MTWGAAVIVVPFATLVVIVVAVVIRPSAAEGVVAVLRALTGPLRVLVPWQRTEPIRDRDELLDRRDRVGLTTRDDGPRMTGSGSNLDGRQV
jgi:hypothetical protein